ncbi:MFS transporter [Streptomyces sp. N2-109]|uniref:MFS transporter n=1 Tax=Streptomyces gossypii TaxID=2883101 RepID=A0ABT2K334_9ACTN|nr:MFS transporter [Streptomyces gossypii]MCT2594034.1 MFS transporter [Streptomyces gossypii]
MKKRYAFWSYAAGAAVARTGDEMSGPALLLAGLAATGSAASASTLLAGLTAAAAVGGPVFGVLLDRSAAPGRLLAGALGLYAAALAVILVGLGRLPLGVTALLAVSAGLLGPALSGGWTSQLPRVVTPDEVDLSGHRTPGLPRANAIDAMTFHLAGLAGPALAGAVAACAGASAGLAVASALICLALPAAWVLPAARTPADGGPRVRRAPRATSAAADLAAGFRVLRRSVPLARATVTSVISCAAGGMLAVCAPLLGERVLGAAGHGTALLAGVAGAALAANALLARHPGLLRPDTLVWCSVLVLAAALMLAATVRPVPLACAVVLAGIGEGLLLAALFAVRYREVPARLRGQIFTTGASLKITGFACGAGVAGSVTAWSLPGTLLIAAGLQVLAALAFGWISWVPGQRGEMPGEPCRTNSSDISLRHRNSSTKDQSTIREGRYDR